MGVHICVCLTRTCMHACMHVCVCVRISISMCVHIIGLEHEDKPSILLTNTEKLFACPESICFMSLERFPRPESFLILAHSALENVHSHWPIRPRIDNGADVRSRPQSVQTWIHRCWALNEGWQMQQRLRMTKYCNRSRAGGRHDSSRKGSQNLSCGWLRR
jgi:hypothetical protein